MLKLYDTLSREIRDFKPIINGEAGIYSCGPTVYNYVHLGNLRAYIFVDLLKRYLKYSGYKVKHVANITDVDDKTIKGSKENGQSLKEFTQIYTKAYLEDLGHLNVLEPDVMPKATEHIAEMVDIIKRLEKKGLAYRSQGSIYYKISADENYGSLAQLDRQSLKENADGRMINADQYEKDEVNDFVLWKAWDQDDGEVYWETEIGKGRPGWHIECSAMSMKYLGETLDIHCGGIDLIFPHHTNEIAQSEGATGKRFVNFWVHNAHLMVEGRKMSKSLNNFYTLKDIIAKGFDPLLLRIIFLKTHYRQVLNFMFEEFAEAEAISKKFTNFLINLDFVTSQQPNNLDIIAMVDAARQKFESSLDNDLNFSEALAAVYELMGEANKSMDKLNAEQAPQIKQFILKTDEVFGFIAKLYEAKASQLESLANEKGIKKLLAAREQARQDKNFIEADRIRDKIKEAGIIIEDTKNGYILKLD